MRNIKLVYNHQKPSIHKPNGTNILFTSLVISNLTYTISFYIVGSKTLNLR